MPLFYCVCVWSRPAGLETCESILAQNPSTGLRKNLQISYSNSPGCGEQGSEPNEGKVIHGHVEAVVESQVLAGAHSIALLLILEFPLGAPVPSPLFPRCYLRTPGLLEDVMLQDEAKQRPTFPWARNVKASNGVALPLKNDGFVFTQASQQPCAV